MDISEYLFPTLQAYGFEVKNESDNRIQFQSPIVSMIISYNKYENSYLIEMGKKDNEFYPLNDLAIRNLFKQEKSIEKVSQNEFIKYY